MLDEEFFHSELGWCVIQSSILGEEITFSKIRELWGKKESLNNSERDFLLLELAKLEIETSDNTKGNIITFKGKKLNSCKK